MPWPGHALDRGEGRYPHFHGPARYPLLEQPQAVPNGSSQGRTQRLRPGRERRGHSGQACRAEDSLGRKPRPWRLAERCSLLIQGGKQLAQVRSARWHG
jgi:hypothetical protein